VSYPLDPDLQWDKVKDKTQEDKLYNCSCIISTKTPPDYNIAS
jgi:hypothetical protein